GILWGPALARAEEGGEGLPSSGSSTDSSSSDSSSSSSSEAASCTDSGVTVTFDVGSTKINNRGRSSLNGVAKWLKTEDGRTAEVNGYTDDSGGSALNQELSQDRAQVVKTYLVAQGVEPGRIDATGHGESEDRPADLDNTRAVAVTVCEATRAEAPPAAATPEPPPAAEVEPPPAPPAPPPPVAVRPLAPSRVYESHTVTRVAAPPPRPDLPPSRIGVGLTLGGGATGFWQEGTRGFVDTGGMWEARLAFGTRLPVAFEAAYVGSAQGI